MLKEITLQIIRDQLQKEEDEMELFRRRGNHLFNHVVARPIKSMTIIVVPRIHVLTTKEFSLKHTPVELIEELFDIDDSIIILK